MGKELGLLYVTHLRKNRWLCPRGAHHKETGPRLASSPSCCPPDPHSPLTPLHTLKAAQGHR